MNCNSTTSSAYPLRRAWNKPCLCAHSKHRTSASEGHAGMRLCLSHWNLGKDWRNIREVEKRLMWEGIGTRQVDFQVPGLGQLANCGAIIQKRGGGRGVGRMKKKINLILNICSLNKIATPLANKCCRVVIVADGHWNTLMQKFFWLKFCKKIKNKKRILLPLPLELR